MTILVIYFKTSFRINDNCIVFSDFHACYAFKILNSKTYNYNDYKFVKFNLDKSDYLTSLQLDKLLEKSFLTKDTVVKYEIDITNSSYRQFIFIIDRCIKNKVKQILLDRDKNKLYIYPDNKVKIEESFIGCFYTINSDSIDFNRPKSID